MLTVKNNISKFLHELFQTDATQTDAGAVVARMADHRILLRVRKQFTGRGFKLLLAFGVEARSKFAPLFMMYAENLMAKDRSWYTNVLASSLHRVVEQLNAQQGIVETHEGWKLALPGVKAMFINPEELKHPPTLISPNPDMGARPPVHVSYSVRGIPSTFGGGRGVNPPHRAPYFRDVKSGAGMTQAGVDKYRRDNPNSHLQTAVTEAVPRTEERAKRRRAFCSRSRSWHGLRGVAARRRWRC